MMIELYTAALLRAELQRLAALVGPDVTINIVLSSRRVSGALIYSEDYTATHIEFSDFGELSAKIEAYAADVRKTSPDAEYDSWFAETVS
jgi:hypothetical protein